MQSSRHQRANFSVQALMQLLNENGHDPALCLEGTDLTPSEILNSSTVISDTEEIGIVSRALGQLARKAGYGIRTVGTFQSLTYGAWGLAITSSPNLREAFEVATRYSASFSLSRPRLRFDGPRFALIADMHDLPSDIHCYVFERVYSTYMMFVRDMLPDQDPSMFELHLPLHDLSYAKQLEEITGHRVVSDKEHFAIETATDWLAQPLERSDPIGHGYFIRQMKEFLEPQQKLSINAELVRCLMLEQMQFSPLLEDVAAQAGLSARSFRRRLQEEGTTFTEVVLSTKMTFAKELLGKVGLSVTSTALRLGYSEAATFSRAYKSWWGHTPGQEIKRGS